MSTEPTRTLAHVCTNKICTSLSNILHLSMEDRCLFTLFRCFVVNQSKIFKCGALHAGDEEACDYVGRKMNHVKLCERRTSADLWGCAEHTKWLWSHEFVWHRDIRCTFDQHWLTFLDVAITGMLCCTHVHFVLPCRFVCSDTPNKLNKEQTNDFKSELIDMRSSHTSSAHTLRTLRTSLLRCANTLETIHSHLPRSGSRQAFAFIQIQCYTYSVSRILSTPAHIVRMSPFSSTSRTIGKWIVTKLPQFGRKVSSSVFIPRRCYCIPVSIHF